MIICEIFRSLQGESTYAGLPCTFIRASGCNLSCTYCDTKYAFSEGTELSIDEILEKARSLATPLVEITGGEPLIQDDTPILVEKLLQENYTVLIETNGSIDISKLPSGCIRIIDIKCPSSGSGSSFLPENFDYLNETDQIKCVISSHSDFEWASDIIKSGKLDRVKEIIFSPNVQLISPANLADLILNSNLNIRLGLQMHKFIWGDLRGK